MSFLNLAKEAYGAYKRDKSPQPSGVTQAQAQTQPATNFTGGTNSVPSNSVPPNSESLGFNFNSILSTLQDKSNPTHAEPSMVQSALTYLNDSGKQTQEPVDEAAITQAHDQAYSDKAAPMDPKAIGMAAALQAFKAVSGSGHSSHSSKSKLIAMAVSEASKLFDKKGAGQSGDKQTAMNSAVMTIGKLLVQSKSTHTGAGHSGGLMAMAQAFMKH